MSTDPDLPRRLGWAAAEVDALALTARNLSAPLSPLSAIPPPSIWVGKARTHHERDILTCRANINSAASVLESLAGELRYQAARAASAIAAEAAAEAARKAKEADDERREQANAVFGNPFGLPNT